MFDAHMADEPSDQVSNHKTYQRGSFVDSNYYNIRFPYVVETIRGIRILLFAEIPLVYYGWLR